MAKHSLAHGGLGVVTTHWGVTFTHFYLLVGVIKLKFIRHYVYKVERKISTVAMTTWMV